MERLKTVKDIFEDLRKESMKRIKSYRETRDHCERTSNDWYFWHGKMGAEMFAFGITKDEIEKASCNNCEYNQEFNGRMICSYEAIENHGSPEEFDKRGICENYKEKKQ